MAYSMCVFHLFVVGVFLLGHADVVESFIRGPPEHTGLSSDTTTKLSSLKVLNLLEPNTKISTQETQIPVCRTALPSRHFSPYKKLAQMVPRRPLSKPLKELSRSITSIRLRDLQNIARGIQHPQQEDHMARTISIALEALQNQDLSIRERIWALTLLDGLRAYLPSIELIGIRTNVAEGPVFRGALELHLSQGIDLLSISQNLWLTPFAERDTHLALAEALERSRVLSNIKEDLEKRPDYKLPPKLRKLYDSLLQASFPLTDEDDLKLIVACSTKIDINWESEDLTTFAVFYHMMNHFMRYDQNIMSLISEKLLSLPLGAWTQNLFMTTSVKTDIDFLLRGRYDTYLENIFEPFLEDEHVGLSHFKHVLDVLKAQELALQTFKEAEYGIPFSHIQDYLMDTHSLLHVLYRSSKYHPTEVAEYLSTELTWSGNRLTFKEGKKEPPPQSQGVKSISIQEQPGNNQDMTLAPKSENQETPKSEGIHFKEPVKQEYSQDEKLSLKSEPVMIHNQLEQVDLRSGHTETTPQSSPSTSQLKRGREEERDGCPLCLQEFQVAHRVLKLPCDKNVPHIFHERCLLPWYYTHDTCPSCRREIDGLEKRYHVFWSESLSTQNKQQKT